MKLSEQLHTLHSFSLNLYRHRYDKFGCMSVRWKFHQNSQSRIFGFFAFFFFKPPISTGKNSSKGQLRCRHGVHVRFITSKHMCFDFQLQFYIVNSILLNSTFFHWVYSYNSRKIKCVAKEVFFSGDNFWMNRILITLL